MLTFKVFLRIINENSDIEGAIAQIQQQMGMIDSQINQRTQSLIAQKNQLQKKLVPLLKRKEQEQKNMNNQPQNQDQNQPMQANNQTTTPGSAGNATPGIGNTMR